MATRRIKRTARKPKTTVSTARRTADVPTTVEHRNNLLTAGWSTLVLVLMGLILAFGLYLIFRVPQTDIGGATATIQTENEVTYQGVESKTALELLKEKADVETKTYEGLGELVTSINGKASTSDQFWAFYINGQQAQVGAGSYVTKSTDVLSWKYEKAQ